MNQTEKIEELLDWADQKAELVVGKTHLSALEFLLKKGQETRQKMIVPVARQMADLILNTFKKYNQKIKNVRLNSCPSPNKFLMICFQTKGGLSFKIGLNIQVGYFLIDGFLGGQNGISLGQTKTEFSPFEQKILKQILSEIAEKFLQYFSLEMEKKIHVTFEKAEMTGLFFDLETHQQTGQVFLQMPIEVKQMLTHSCQKGFSQKNIKNLLVTQHFLTTPQTYTLKEIATWERGTILMLNSTQVVGKIQTKTVNTGVLTQSEKNIIILTEKTVFP